MSNRLAQETSPYLLQHKDNPVDWFPWGKEAFARAEAEQKPILLSVGYAACHWCHVMAHESFEDPETARIINEHFIAVKVDREERPDVDAVYMAAVQAMTGQGGWPMTVFLTPERAPFYGGTYFPPTERHGLPSFPRLLLELSKVWQERKGDALEQAQSLIEHIDASDHLLVSADPVTADVLDGAAISITQTLDTVYGGFGSAPKFPQAPVLDLLLRLSQRGADTQGPLTLTLDRMAAGGIFDQLAGGFHRYSVDRQWVVPHFEKMLYDNAQLLRTYARAWQRFGTGRYREVAEATGDWLLREMRDPSGGFWSSLDADSEEIEGKFYVWSLEEVKEVTGHDASAACERWGFTAQGNFEGQNIPILAGGHGRNGAIARARTALLERRAQRKRPGTDTKVITSWNALAASALAEAGTILGASTWITAAQECMDLVLGPLCVRGRLMRSYKDGDVRYLGYAEDYAFTLEACLALYEATFEPQWLDHARWAADAALDLFSDERGGFFTTGGDAER
ncbi:MAG: thioredoxin domain-containing protein, partial [Actinomycetota bacterium]|nr:thioredoxin domain-containing protein [Actinomycetota bacterium]